mmetsp:Transcript_7807/g.8852  ORF Transcript_7807/g.8852 Transcript_7807/m.8852 type:complete len:144 (+) Transcript_7807:529-960(+)
MQSLCLSLYSLLNQHKIATRESPEGSSPDLIVRLFEGIVHDLRLSRERIENLENEGSEHAKAIAAAKSKSDFLLLANQRLERRIEELVQEAAQESRNHQNKIEEVRLAMHAEKDKGKIEIERMRAKQNNCEIKTTQIEEEVDQ